MLLRARWQPSNAHALTAHLQQKAQLGNPHTHSQKQIINISVNSVSITVCRQSDNLVVLYVLQCVKWKCKLNNKGSVSVDGIVCSCKLAIEVYECRWK